MLATMDPTIETLAPKNTGLHINVRGVALSAHLPREGQVPEKGNDVV